VAAGVVRLAGSVDSCVKWWLVAHLAASVSGVHAVINDVRVDLPDTVHRADGDIADAVQRALQSHPMVPSAHLRVTAADGWIVLNGVVDWESQKRAAEDAVLLLTGVRGVENRIAVRDPVGPDPARLKRRVIHALVQRAEMDANGIEVDVVDGLVVLRGNVRGSADRHEIEQVAWSTPGTTFVENRISVSL
jgi:osmotically-inducible protein OsmY